MRILLSRLLPGLLLPWLAIAGTASADDVLIELDRCVEPSQGTYGDHGGYGFDTHGCSGATEGYALEGLDLAGEWFEIWNLHFPNGVCFVDSLKSAGVTGSTRGFLIEWRASYDGPPDATDSLRTDLGLGIG